MLFILPLHYNKLIQPFNEIIDKFFDYLIINKINSPEFFFLRSCFNCVKTASSKCAAIFNWNYGMEHKYSHVIVTSIERFVNWVAS